MSIGLSDGVKSDTSLKDELERVITDVEHLEEGAEPTNSKTVQEAVKRNIDALEKLTRTVSQLSMFSGNEDIGEIPADSVRFLALPALLGILTGKLISGDRLENLEREQAYYRDFLQRLQSYGVIDRTEDESEVGADGSAPAAVDPSRKRQKKIERYNERKNLQEKLESLRQRSKNNVTVDDDLLRDLHVTELKIWAGKISDNLEAVQQEIKLLRMRENTNVNASTSASANSDQRTSQPLKPFIITRTDLQKAVYGAGYPSLPTLSLEEFFEQKRQEGQVQVVSQGDAKPPGPQTNEEDNILREQREDREDADLSQHDRQLDEYRDEHRRGWGNVHNKG